MVDEHEMTPADENALAPPLVSPHAAPARIPAPPPYGATPPYYQQQAQHHPPSPYSQPHQPAPHSPGNGGKIALIVISSIAAFTLIIVFIAVGMFTWLAQTAESQIDSAPDDSSISAEEADEPGDGGWADSADTDDTTDASDSSAGDSIGIRLDAKIDEYRLARDDGSLWESIPDTEFNRTAVSAFLYLLTDMKVATIWGVDSGTAQEYSDRAADLEELLLSEQPLGSDVQIALSDRVFRYDGDTGEGGYSDE